MNLRKKDQKSILNTINNWSNENPYKSLSITLLIAVTILIVLHIVFSSPESIESENKKYFQKYRSFKVEVTYCDNRPKKTITVYSKYSPTNNDIENYRRAVPSYKNQLNVCEINTLKELE